MPKTMLFSLIAFTLAVVGSSYAAEPTVSVGGDLAAKQGWLVKIMTLDVDFPDVEFVAGVVTDAAADNQLPPSAFALTESGLLQEPTITWLSGGGTSSSIDVIVVFDVSGSLYDEVEAMQEGSAAFVQGVYDLGMDAHFALVTFTGEYDSNTGNYSNAIEVAQDLTSDAQLFQEAIAEIEVYGAGPNEPCLDGVMAGVTQVNRRPYARPVFLVVTDEPTLYRGDGYGLSNYTMQETIDAILAEEGVVFVCSSDYGWGSGSSYWEMDVRSLAEETDGLWADINAVDFDLFLDNVVSNLVPRYLVSYSTTNTRSDGAQREIFLNVIDPVEGHISGTASYIAPFIQDPSFDVPFAVYGDPGYTTEDPDLALQGFCDPQCTGLLVNGSDEGLTYTPGSVSWSYEGALDAGVNVIEMFSLDRFGNLYGPATATYTYDPNPNLVSVVVDALQHELILYDKIRIEGALEVPESSGLLSGRMVRIRYEHPEVGAIEQYAVTDTAGGFIDSIRADRLGVWTIRAKFDGDDDFKESGWSAPSVLVTVSRDTDIDKNGEVNALDVQLTINSALGQDIGPLIADSNVDGATDALDIQRVINAALAL